MAKNLNGDNVFARIGRYYDKLVSEHGCTPRACDYGRPESQKSKFRALADAFDYNGRRVLDVGCGLADFSDYLEAMFEGVNYTGVDISDSMIDNAAKRKPLLDLRVLNILTDDPGGSYDIVTSNGIFYLLGPDAPQLMQDLISRMYELAGAAVCFTSLSTWADDKEEGEFYADPIETLEYCRSLTPWVVLRHDYHSRDFCIYMYRERHSW